MKAQEISKKEILKKVWTYIKSYQLLVIFSAILALAVAVLSLYLPILVGEGIDKIVAPGQVDFSGLRRILNIIVVVTVLTSLLQWWMNRINYKITYHVVGDIRKDVFLHLQKLPLKYMDGHQVGDIVSRVIADADQFADGLLLGISQLFSGCVTILGTLLFMLFLDPFIAVVVVLLTPLSLLVAKYIAQNTYHLFREQSVLKGEQTAYIEEMVGNLKLVQAFSSEERICEAFDEKNSQLEGCSLKAVFFSSLTNPCTRFVNSVVYAAVALCGAFVALKGGITIGGLSSFLSYAKQYTKPFNEISGVITELQSSLACAGRIFQLLEEKEQEPDPQDSVVLKEAEGLVEFSNVSFSYEPEQKLIQNLNLKVIPGQKIAIVGPTGCGKTTLINLLMRFYEVTKGEIKVDHKEIRKITRESLRKNYGMVLQETWLKEGTVAENIAMGRPTASREEIEAAAKASYCHGFIKRLPQGYDTYLTEDGGNLSQGQKQLLCIARIMLTLPPMLILDEATSSIDTRTEIKIQEAFGKLMEGRVSFIVAHRLSTIRDADLILVMKEGNIVEQGDHDSLLKKKGFYYSLYYSD
ncbi:MAG: ABC transporter ATP-binding protein [Lachnospiraceae bacterium]|nr:ABC transporter ATP-binding protein [Lachnospiraceae bacterium]